MFLGIWEVPCVLLVGLGMVLFSRLLLQVLGVAVGLLQWAKLVQAVMGPWVELSHCLPMRYSICCSFPGGASCSKMGVRWSTSYLSLIIH